MAYVIRENKSSDFYYIETNFGANNWGKKYNAARFTYKFDARNKIKELGKKNCTIEQA